MTKLSAYLRRMKIAPRDLAKASGGDVSARTIVNLCHGHTDTKIETAKQVAAALTRMTGRVVNVSEIFDLDHSPARKRRAV